ncbi:MAG: pinensin family lanthipeptide [Cyclobacteriaceae bacterium]
MNNEKLTLKKLTVQSFITEINGLSAQTLKAGVDTVGHTLEHTNCEDCGLSHSVAGPIACTAATQRSCDTTTIYNTVKSCADTVNPGKTIG